MPSSTVSKALDSRGFSMGFAKFPGNERWRCREKEAGVKGFAYGLSVESFFPKRRAKRTMPGERSSGLKSTLRK